MTMTLPIPMEHGLLLAAVIGVPVYAVICHMCSVCLKCSFPWCPLECYFI